MSHAAIIATIGAGAAPFALAAPGRVHVEQVLEYNPLGKPGDHAARPRPVKQCSVLGPEFA